MICMIYFEIRCEIFDWKVDMRKMIDPSCLAAVSPKECIPAVLRSLNLEIHWYIDNLLSLCKVYQ
jgi:hypothetical protein